MDKFYRINRDCEVRMTTDDEKRFGFVWHSELSDSQIQKSWQEYTPNNPYVYPLIKDGKTIICSVPADYEDKSIEEIINLCKTSTSKPEGIYFDEFFSIELITRCLHGIIKESLSNCSSASGSCNKYNVDTSTRDFLFVSVYILEHLINDGRIYEAESILEQIGHCVPICSNTVMKPFDCNCK